MSNGNLTDLVEDALVSILANDSAVSALIGDKVRPYAAGQLEELPYCCYYRASSGVSNPALNGRSGRVVLTFEIDCNGSNYSESKTVSRAVGAAFEDNDGGRIYVFPGIQITTFLQDSRDDPEPRRDSSANFVPRVVVTVNIHARRLLV